jgi:hypothetical protein
MSLDVLLPHHGSRPEDNWRVWRTFSVRSAGFPAEHVLAFAAPDATAAIHALHAEAAAAEAARLFAIELCVAAIPTVEQPHRKLYRKALERLRAAKQVHEYPADLSDAMAPIHASEQRILALERVVADTLERERVAISTALRNFASDARFREAIVWQNSGLIDRLIEPLLRTSTAATDAHTRQRELAIATYAQRYSVKNDTAGFFGPTGWATFSDADMFARVQPGVVVVSRSEICFEHWGIDAIAMKLSADLELRQWVPPRRMPTVRLDGDRVYFPFGRSAALPPNFLELLGACDGVTSARTIARTLVGGDDQDAIAEIYGMLDELVEKRLALWSLEVPTVGRDPEQHLRTAVMELPDTDARAHAVAVLDELEAARGAISRAAGNPGELLVALNSLEALFTRLTGAAPTRNAGQMYAARTLVFSDSVRDVEIEFGRGFLAKLGPPLQLVMTGARWYTYTVAAAYRQMFEELYRELAGSEAAVDFVTFFARAIVMFGNDGDTPPAVQAVVDMCHERWMRVLDITGSATRIERSVASLSEAVEREFAAPGPGWPQARHHSPDLMVAAAGLEGLQRGEFVCALNETHVGIHTYIRPVFAELANDPDAVMRQFSAEVGRPLLQRVAPRTHTNCSDHSISDPRNIDLEMNDAKSWRLRSSVVEAANLVVTEIDGRVIVTTRDRERTFDLVEIFEIDFMLAASSVYRLVPPLPHTPRVTIDNLIVSRESWTFTPDQVTFAKLTGPAQFTAARAWVQQHRLPRFVFVRVPHETKPYYTDLNSPIFVDNMAKLVRQTSGVVRISEMLPDLSETWLVDREKRRYTCELRIAVVDPLHWKA